MVFQVLQKVFGKPVYALVVLIAILVIFTLAVGLPNIRVLVNKILFPDVLSPMVPLDDHLGDIPSETHYGSVDRMTAISMTDHIRGNRDAPVKIVEYLDTECPLCKRSYFDMQKILSEYEDKVALVYRHLPLSSHPRSRKEAEALECANELGGNDAFWKYADRLFEITPSGNKLNPVELPRIASYIGLDEAAFSACLDSGTYAKHVEENVQDAVATGANGNPWSIVVAANGKKYPLSGAQPYASVKQLIELALKEK